MHDFIFCQIEKNKKIKEKREIYSRSMVCTSALSSENNYITEHLYCMLTPCLYCSKWLTCINSFPLQKDNMSEILLKYYFSFVYLHISLLCFIKAIFL